MKPHTNMATLLQCLSRLATMMCDVTGRRGRRLELTLPRRSACFCAGRLDGVGGCAFETCRRAFPLPANNSYLSHYFLIHGIGSVTPIIRISSLYGGNVTRTKAHLCRMIIFITGSILILCLKLQIQKIGALPQKTLH